MNMNSYRLPNVGIYGVYQRLNEPQFDFLFEEDNYTGGFRITENEDTAFEEYKKAINRPYILGKKYRVFLKTYKEVISECDLTNPEFVMSRLDYKLTIMAPVLKGYVEGNVPAGRSGNRKNVRLNSYEYKPTQVDGCVNPMTGKIYQLYSDESYEDARELDKFYRNSINTVYAKLIIVENDKMERQWGEGQKICKYYSSYAEDEMKKLGMEIDLSVVRNILDIGDRAGQEREELYREFCNGHWNGVKEENKKKRFHWFRRG